jgi:Methyltransferase domain
MRFAAARPALSDPKLRYSLAEFAEVIFAAFDAAAVRSVVEIGAEGGAFTEQLASWAKSHDGVLTSIDPAPSGRVRTLAAHSDTMTLHERTSHSVLPELPPHDAYLIDGDHNYFTVSGELAAICAVAEKTAAHPLVVLQDVGWPAGHRDQYYDPEAIPEHARQPYSYGGVLPWKEDTLPSRGFRGEGAFAFATHEGGAGNGVLQALEDFLAAHQGYEVISLPCIFGLAFLFREHSPWAAALRQAIGILDDHPLLARLESNRVLLYLTVLDLQDALAAERRRAGGVEAALREQLGVLHTQLGAAHQELRQLRATSDQPAVPARALRAVGGRCRMLKVLDGLLGRP